MATRDLKADGKTWAALHEDWVFANEAHLRASAVIRTAFMECAAGNGTGPSIAQLNSADRFKTIADGKYALTQAFLTEVFG